jgi:cellulose synthase/poly-beta-1,6-N-acetylglucosamine synthase-like glycosyltransferase
VFSLSPIVPSDVSTSPLSQALRRNSPRYTLPSTPWRSRAIHGGVLLLWALLLAAAFQQGGVAAWGVGIAYVCYDTALLLFVGWHARRLMRPPTATTTSANTPTGPRRSVGVIVAAHNEAAVLPLTLSALLTQRDALDQIVIADDGSTDGTAALLQGQYGLRQPELGQLSEASTLYPTLYWLRMPHGGKARTMNTALQRIHTEAVMTVDGDTLLDAQAVAAVRRAFSAEPELVAATGVITPVCSKTASGRVLQWFQTYEYIRNFLSRYAWSRLDSLLLISGAFACFRRDAVLAVGGFDADCLVEDYELIHRLHRHAATQGLDWRVRVLGDAQARTDAPSDVMAFLRQRRRWFGGFLQTQYWYRDMVGDARYGWLGRLMLPVKAADTLQPLYGLTALFLLFGFVASGHYHLLLPAASAIGLKILIDLAYHLWSVQLYRRWVGDTGRASLFEAFCAALAEPFTFQLLRHTGAAWGWWSVLTGRASWGKQARLGLAAHEQRP